MAGFVNCLCIVLFLVSTAITLDSPGLKRQRITGIHPVDEFTKHTLVKPRIYHGREKRQVSSSKDKGNQHFPELTITLDIDGENFDLDLVLNNGLITKEYFRKYQENGKHKIHKPSPEEVELCHYTGKVRGRSNSWVALSTCSGLQGLIYDGREIHYIDRNLEKSLLERPHYLYKHSDLVESNHTSCGHDESRIENNVVNKIAKFKRSTDEVISNIRGPYKSTSDSRYLELVLVVDNALYKEFDEDLSKVEEYCISLTNVINGIYSRLNIYVALVGVVVWTEREEIDLSGHPDTILSKFLAYRKNELLKSHPNDNAQLLTKQSFQNGTLSKALKGPICTYEYSGGINTVFSQIIAKVARLVSHSIGHNFGMEHDTSECNCPDEHCVMSKNVTATPLNWSNCSFNYLEYAFAHGMDHCLKNKPQSLIGSPVCGNGFVDPGEQCDCGLPENCQSNCCNPETCTLFSNATCATGACCNQETCELKRAGTVCRSADEECDLPEHCTGDSEYCPADVFKMNSEVCGMGKAFCFNGRCKSRNDQCKLLWGETGKSSDDVCYGLNIKGSRFGNCGYDPVNQTYSKCEQEDNMCGRLHCKHYNERLEYGLESTTIMSHSFINKKGTIVPCRSAIIDLGLDEVDPGMVPNGAKCGDNKMCVDQKCVDVEDFQSTITTCSSNCNGNGVCNSLGNCHCFEGFSPPFCNSTGDGGSSDSGPTRGLTALQHPTHEFINHTIIIPKVFHAREKRRVLNTKEEGRQHIPELTISIEIDNEEYILDLILNKHLIPKGFFHKTQKNGKPHLHKPSDEEIDLCHYTGKVRGVPESWVALSTCSGLRGLFYDGTEMHYIERDGEEGLLERPHYLYKHSDLAEHNKTCGYEGNHIKDHDIHDHAVHNIYNRFKRSTEVRDRIRGPINASSDTKYLEFLLVIDNREYRELGESTSRISQHCITIANIINGLFSQLNIFVALVGVVIWSEHDEIGFSENGDITLTSFLHYRREKLIFEHPNDNAQLLTKFNFNNGVVGKALKGPICTYQFSGGINTDHSSVVALVASTIAHEIGHNFGMEHDTADCDCPDDKCIMSASSGSVAPVHWSSCSLRYLLHAFTHGMDYCLKNKPQSIFMSPICGNGFVEPGEECDCGLPENCQSNCCNPDTCQLYSNATCATGACCDQETCEPKRAGILCRPANLECDLPEYCTGDSEFCPPDVFKMNSEVCGGGEAYCFDGLCRTRTDQCKLLWGETGESSGVQCYEQMNIKGNRTGNCGYDKLTKDYFRCEKEDVMCGLLQCKHLNERLEFGMESAAILSHSFINFHGVILPCRTAVIDLGLNETDPGLTPSGASCGDSKLCVNQKCVEVAKFRSTIKTCPNNCNGNGVCNSLGHCHCFSDFAPPFCEGVGTGGSIDSGPTRDPAGHKVFRNAMFIIFLGIIPFLALMFLLWYYAWKKHGWIKPSPPTLKSPGKSRGFQPEPTRQTEDNHSLLQPETITSGQPNEFFGNFKGFSLKPLDKPEPEPSRTAPPPPYTPNIAKSTTPEPVPIRSAPAPPCAEAKTVETTPTSKSPSSGKSLQVKSPVVINKLNSVASAKNSFLHKPSKTPFFKQPAIKGGLSDVNDTVVAPALPPPNPGSSARPIISSPVLENSTCTAKELISPLKIVPKVPCRSAPTAPVTASETKRPLSSPEITVNSVTPSSTSEEVKKTVNSTLNRIASFLKPADKKPAVQVSNTNSLPRNKVKANKIDKQTLRGIEISNPIPQTAIELGVTSLPVDEVDGKAKTAVVMRAQSMRGTNVTEKPVIHTFGSMRQPGKRPVSIPSGVRPKSPPPPLPSEAGANDKIKIMSVYKQPRVKFQSNNQYDDCLNKETKSIGSSASNDNIYSVIEESPVKSPGPVPVPVPVVGQNSSESGDGLGLLGEIVSEINNRNQESIYSTSTLSKKKKEDEVNKNKEEKTSDPSESELYENSALFYKTPESVYSNMNSTSSSSGYIQPNAINAPVRNENKRTEQNEPKNDKPIFSTFRTEKPFTTFTKPDPPAPIYNNTNTITSHTPPKSATDGDKTSIRTKTPSPTGRGAKIARQTTPPNLKSKHSPTRKAPSPGTVKSNRSVTNSPDLVTSCSTKPATKPPDVLGGSAMNKKPSILASKPSLPKGQTKGVGFRQTQDKKSFDVKPPVVGKVGKPAVDNNNSNKNSGSAGSKPVSRQNSNVASLQQKFEGKSNSAANSRPTIKSKA